VAPARTAPPSRTVFGLAVILTLVFFGAVFVPMWQPLLLGCVLAAAFMRWQDGLARRLGGRRSWAAGLITLAVVVLVVAPLATIGTLLVKQAVEGAQALQGIVQERGVQGTVEDTIERLPDRVQDQARSAVKRLPKSWGGVAERAAAQGAAAAGVLSSALSSTSSALFDAAMMLIALFFLLIDGHRLVAWLCRASPLGEETTGRILFDLRRTGTSVLASLVATAAVQAVVATIGYFIARVPQPLLFGLLTFIAAFIPSVGTSIVALPIAIVLMLAGHLVAGIFLAVWALIVVGTIDNVLKPILAKGGMPIHGAIIFFAMIGGLVSFGTLGLLVGPLAVSLLLTMVQVAKARSLLPHPALEPPLPPPPGAEGDGGVAARPHHDA
jgi:predicted PurR-regulated permease PerM